MQGNWYNSFLDILRGYYRIKIFALFIIKVILFVIFFSVFIDIVCGFFPDIFHHKVYTAVWKAFSIWFAGHFNSFYKLIIFIIIFCIYFFYYFPRLSVMDFDEVTKREELEELKKKQMEINAAEGQKNKQQISMDTLKNRDVIIKKNIKKIEKLLKKHF